ncbi:secretin N-terminal domain-containing protein [candidate division KSB1 bacterium]
MDKSKKIIIFILLLSIFAACPIYSQFQQSESKTYKLEHRLTEDFVPLIQALLSKKGQIRESKEMNMIIVNDFPANLIKIDSLIAQNDKPLKQILVTVQLFICSKIDDALVPPEFAETRKLTEGFYDFNTFEKIDRALIIAQENSATSFLFAGEKYSVSFILDYIEEIGRTVSFRNFILTEIDKDIKGKIEKKVFETSTKIPDKNQIILSASKYKNTEKTLVVIVGVQIS